MYYCAIYHPPLIRLNCCNAAKQHQLADFFLLPFCWCDSVLEYSACICTWRNAKFFDPMFTVTRLVISCFRLHYYRIFAIRKYWAQDNNQKSIVWSVKSKDRSSNNGLDILCVVLFSLFSSDLVTIPTLFFVLLTSETDSGRRVIVLLLLIQKI